MEPILILIPATTFVMGSDAGQEDETPPHTVELSPFYLGRCAVTNREYALFLEQSAISPPVCWNDPRFNHPDQPVVAVNWFEASAYCEWLGRQQGKLYRLPTEARGNWPAAAVPLRHTLGVKRPSVISGIMVGGGSKGVPNWWAGRPMDSVSATWPTMFTNGAWIGMEETTTG